MRKTGPLFVSFLLFHTAWLHNRLLPGRHCTDTKEFNWLSKPYRTRRKPTDFPGATDDIESHFSQIKRKMKYIRNREKAWQRWAVTHADILMVNTQKNGKTLSQFLDIPIWYGAASETQKKSALFSDASVLLVSIYGKCRRRRSVERRQEWTWRTRRLWVNLAHIRHTRWGAAG